MAYPVPNQTLDFLNGVYQYHHPAQSQGQSQSGFGGVGGIIQPSVQVPLMLPGLLGGGGGGGHSVNVIAADPRMLQEVRHQQQEDREENRATTAACLGGIGTIILSGLSALALRGYCDDRDELRKANEFKNNTLPYLPDPNLRAHLTPIVDTHIDILETKTGRARNILLITGAALLTGVAAFIGGMMAIQWLITAAIIAGVALAAIGVFLVVWHCTEKTSLSHEMHQNILHLRQQLQAQPQP